MSVLALEQLDDGRFRAAGGDEGHAVVFGGQLLASSLLAAARTVADKDVLTMHTVFSRGASPAEPLDVAVDVVHAGRSFATATVTVSQSGRPCTVSLLLLHAPDPDRIRHAADPPRVTPPDVLPGRDGWWDVRIVDGVDLGDPDAVGPAELRVWTRFPEAPGGDVAASQALLAYATDGFLIGTAMRPHPGVGQSMAHVSIQTTVLDHTLTFHEPFRADEWLLLDQRSTYAGRGRARGRAEVFTADGRLVASFAQDAMVRA